MYRNLNLQHHIENDFPENAREQRLLPADVITKAWYLVTQVIRSGFSKAKFFPTRLRDAHGHFLFPSGPEDNSCDRLGGSDADIDSSSDDSAA